MTGTRLRVSNIGDISEVNYTLACSIPIAGAARVSRHWGRSVDKRRSAMLKLIAILFGLLIAAQTSLADDRAKVVGVWKLLSFETEFQDGSPRRPAYGPNPTGYIIFTA